MSDTKENAIPSEAECMERILACMNGLGEQERDYEEAARWARRGHELGYLKCTIELAECYNGGYGVPRDFNRALELAHDLEAKGSPLAWRLLAEACAEGHGMPLDLKKAQEYAEKLRTALSAPVLGVDDDQRREALLSIYVLLNSVSGTSTTEEYLRVAREHLRESTQPDRFALYASSLLYQLSEAEDAEAAHAEEILNECMGCLAVGVEQGSAISMYLMSVIIGMRDDPSELKFLPRLLLDASLAGQAVVFGDLLRFGGLPDEYAAICNENYWLTCNLGVSQMRRDGALPCHVRLLYSPFSATWKVHETPGQDVTPITTRLALENEGDSPLSGLSLRLCSSDARVDAHFELEQSIEPEETLELNLAEYEQKAGKPFGKEFYVEVSSGGRSCEMTLDHTAGLRYFYCRWEGVQAPLELWWERSLWGGRVLCARCREGVLHGVCVGRNDGKGRMTRGRTLQAGEVARFGRLDFLSLSGLKSGELLALRWEGMDDALLLSIED